MMQAFSYLPELKGNGGMNVATKMGHAMGLVCVRILISGPVNVDSKHIHSTISRYSPTYTRQMPY